MIDWYPSTDPGAEITAAEPGTDCTDGIYCNGQETCGEDGACGGSTGSPCAGSDTGPSCDDSCNESTFTCDFADAASTLCDEDGDGASGQCDGTASEPNCAGD